MNKRMKKKNEDAFARAFCEFENGALKLRGIQAKKFANELFARTDYMFWLSNTKIRVAPRRIYSVTHGEGFEHNLVFLNPVKPDWIHARLRLSSERKPRRRFATDDEAE